MVRFSAFLFLFCALASWAAEPPCAALYCPVSDASAQAFAALAEGRLSGSKAVWLLDRANIDKVLREQGLTLSGLVAPEDALKAGRLLKVDLFAALEMAQGAKAPFGVVVYDAKLGRRLADRGLPDGSPEDVVAELSKTVERAAAKMSDTPKDAVALCVMPIRNVGLPDDLGYLPHAVHVLLQRALVQNPGVMVLERSYLEYRNAEGLPPSFLNAAVRLELELARSSSGLSVRGALVAADGKRRSTIAAELRKPTPDGIVAAVLSQIQLNGVMAPALKPRQEAERFHHEAELLRTCGELKAAIAAAEAARAFDGSEKYVASLAFCQLAMAGKLLPRAGDLGDLDQAFILAAKAIATRMSAIPPAGQGQEALAVQSSRYFHWSSRGYWLFFNEALVPFLEATTPRIWPPGGRELSGMYMERNGSTQSWKYCPYPVADKVALGRFRETVRDYALRVVQSPLDPTFKTWGAKSGFSIFVQYAWDLQERLDMLAKVGQEDARLPGDILLLMKAFLSAWDTHRGELDAEFARRLALGSSLALSVQAPLLGFQRVMDAGFRPVFAAALAGSPCMADKKSPYSLLVEICRRHPVDVIRLYAAGADLCASLGAAGLTAEERRRAFDRYFGVCGEVLDSQRRRGGATLRLKEHYNVLSSILFKIRDASNTSLGVNPWGETLDLMARRKELCGDLIVQALSWGRPEDWMRAPLANVARALDTPGTHLEADEPDGKNLRWFLQVTAEKLQVQLPGELGGSLSAIWGRRRILAPPEKDSSYGSVAVDGRCVFVTQHLHQRGRALHSMVTGADGVRAPHAEPIPGKDVFRLFRIDLATGQRELLADTERVGMDLPSTLGHQGVVGGGRYFVPTQHLGVLACDLATKRLDAYDTASGLPSNGVVGAAYLEGKLYVGLDSSKGSHFLAIAPESMELKLLGASASRDGTPLFKDSSAHVVVKAMVPFPGERRLLVGVRSYGNPDGYDPPGGRAGLYFFDVVSGGFERLSAVGVDKIVPDAAASRYFLLQEGFSAEVYSPGGGVKTIYNHTCRDAQAKVNPMLPGLAQNLPPDLRWMRPLALIDNHLWTTSPFGRISLASGDFECFPVELVSKSRQAGAEVMPVGDGKQILVSGDCGLVLLDMLEERQK